MYFHSQRVQINQSQDEGILPKLQQNIRYTIPAMTAEPLFTREESSAGNELIITLLHPRYVTASHNAHGWLRRH